MQAQSLFLTFLIGSFETGSKSTLRILKSDTFSFDSYWRQAGI
ncbi:hypothetical protein LEP1GSC036_4555 [Leptospira weilii str. 2006001853]|uniref:Uncharacterized protein n=1 Tax=Leptospira weilii str. 2006001853 TaxID=1001589 RepID=A0A828Z1Y3_9LEPT|nr:hypothetical protein LEP1GSC036_4555 [Leptospira weilii str. 2006001853]